MVHPFVVLGLALSTRACSPLGFTHRLARTHTLHMTSTISPTETQLAILARDARGLAIDAISAVSLVYSITYVAWLTRIFEIFFFL